MATVTVRVPESLLKRAQATTGRRDAEAAVRRALEQSRREERDVRSSANSPGSPSAM